MQMAYLMTYLIQFHVLCQGTKTTDPEALATILALSTAIGNLSFSAACFYPIVTMPPIIFILSPQPTKISTSHRYDGKAIFAVTLL